MRARRELLCGYTLKGEVAGQFRRCRSQRQDWVDLLTDRRASDGACERSKIVQLAIERRLSAIGNSDCDTDGDTAEAGGIWNDAGGTPRGRDKRRRGPEATALGALLQVVLNRNKGEASEEALERSTGATDQPTPLGNS